MIRRQHPDRTAPQATTSGRALGDSPETRMTSVEDRAKSRFCTGLARHDLDLPLSHGVMLDHRGGKEISVERQDERVFGAVSVDRVKEDDCQGRHRR